MHGKELIYPESKVGVMFDYRNNMQRFFDECSDIIIRLTIHPKYTIIAVRLRQH